MPKATLTFNLPEEREEHGNALNGGAYRYILSDLNEYMRRRLKYGEDVSKDERKALETVREMLFNCLKEENLDL